MTMIHISEEQNVRLSGFAFHVASERFVMMEKGLNRLCGVSQGYDKDPKLFLHDYCSHLHLIQVYWVSQVLGSVKVGAGTVTLGCEGSPGMGSQAETVLQVLLCSSRPDLVWCCRRVPVEIGGSSRAAPVDKLGAVLRWDGEQL
ncbi:uncharacterized protein LOC121049824 [Rosa chinensis]|uniref:uncharacterized protein LOC121049824 n=1 Tax=Rosa chinensis TaxID=74649 RepID=UPI001AD90143|nr:uncharacterized protein LOC121049824 [Rosa chinensis]